jgi:hypothetical protein
MDASMEELPSCLIFRQVFIPPLPVENIAVYCCRGPCLSIFHLEYGTHIV